MQKKKREESQRGCCGLSRLSNGSLSSPLWLEFCEFTGSSSQVPLVGTLALISTCRSLGLACDLLNWDLTPILPREGLLADQSLGVN